MASFGVSSYGAAIIELYFAFEILFPLFESPYSLLGLQYVQYCFFVVEASLPSLCEAHLIRWSD
jgi:hypothetical protein